MGISQISDPFSLLDSFSQFPPVRRLVIGLSGGLDSVVLLHAISRIREKLPHQLQAVHVHHGLMPEADCWTRHCENLCDALEIPLQVIRVNVQREGLGLEAAAREARYASLAEWVDAESALLTAHHQDDQVETVLLHLVKGAGSAGLAGMPGFKSFAAGWHFRPLLKFPREQLENYASQYQLDYVQDSSNQDHQFERNYLRHQVIPTLKSRWPDAGAGIARAAGHQSELLPITMELAREDLAQIQCGDGTIDLMRLQVLSKARQNYVLRYWLRELGGGDVNPSKANLNAIHRELIGSAWDREPELLLGDERIYRYRNLLYREPASRADQPENFAIAHNWKLGQAFSLNQPKLHLETRVVFNSYPELDSTCELSVRFRQGGEQIRLPGSSQHKSLKKLLQNWGIPPWRRNRIPLLYHDERLLIVWGYATASGLP